MAILDTGASRSVIGSHHIPAVLAKLPAAVRERVQEKPSRIGFRFGNNEVLYSYKQLRIPLTHKRMRNWLLIEVVPKGTPFLLSIKTMRSLGAQLDLANNQCYLKAIDRSLALKETRNGLIVMDIAELCTPTLHASHRTTDSHPALTASSVATSHDMHDTSDATPVTSVSSTTSLEAPPGLSCETVPSSDHADSSGTARLFASARRADDGDPSHVVHHRVCNDHSDRPSASHHRDGDLPSEPVDPRGDPSERHHRTTGSADHTAHPESGAECDTTNEPGAQSATEHGSLVASAEGISIIDDGFTCVGRGRRVRIADGQCSTNDVKPTTYANQNVISGARCFDTSCLHDVNHEEEPCTRNPIKCSS